MSDELFEPERSHRIGNHWYIVFASPAALPRWVLSMERGSGSGNFLGALIRLRYPETPIEVRVVQARRRMFAKLNIVCAASDLESVDEANRLASQWDALLSNGVVPRNES